MGKTSFMKPFSVWKVKKSTKFLKPHFFFLIFIQTLKKELSHLKWIRRYKNFLFTLFIANFGFNSCLFSLKNIFNLYNFFLPSKAAYLKQKSIEYDRQATKLCKSSYTNSINKEVFYLIIFNLFVKKNRISMFYVANFVFKF